MKIHSLVKNLETYKKYQKLKNKIRSFLISKDFLELDLPVLSPVLIPESCLEVFEANYTYQSIHKKLYLTPSPELFIKRLLVEGVGNCFYMGKSFRNGEQKSTKHAPEFTMLEFYKINSEYMDMADTVLEMLQYLAISIYGQKTILYNNTKINFTKWEKISVAQAFLEFAGISESTLFDKNKFIKASNQKGYNTKGFSYEEVWSQIYAQEVEPNLGTRGFPTLLYDFPISFAPLAKPKNDTVSERFEFYVCGVELGNCFSELTDPKIQKYRFASEQKDRQKSGKIGHPLDTGFIDALKKGMPDSSGIAIGVERLGMIFCNVSDIEDLKILDVY